MHQMDTVSTDGWMALDEPDMPDVTVLSSDANRPLFCVPELLVCRPSSVPNGIVSWFVGGQSVECECQNVYYIYIHTFRHVCLCRCVYTEFEVNTSRTYHRIIVA